jgi:folate-binding protein YgfZ
MMDETHLAAYRAAHEAVAFADLSDWGWIVLAGRDRLDLLHRLTTNDLKKLRPGQGAPTVFTNANGRVIAVATVLAGEDEVFLRTMPGLAAGVTRYLNSMIFWQDEVTVADLTAGAAQFALYGPRSGDFLQSLATEGISHLQPYDWRPAHLSGTLTSVHRGGPLDTCPWLLDVAATSRSAVHDLLSAAAPQLSAESVDLLRIEAGLPLWGRELSEQVTPLETGLLAAISFNKGCYTGQEVIARQTNYDKVTRNLVGLELALPPTSPLLARQEVGAADTQGTSEGPWGLVRGPGRGGFVGSVAYSPSLARVIALAVVPRDLVQAGLEVEVTRFEQSVKAIVRNLPFKSEIAP